MVLSLSMVHFGVSSAASRYTCCATLDLVRENLLTRCERMVLEGRNIMEEKINVEVDRLLEYLGEGKTLDSEDVLARCIGSIIANIIMGER